MKKLVKTLFEKFILKIIPLWLYKLINSNRLTSFFYHSVSDENLPHIKNIYPVLNIKQFRGALKYISTKYNFVGYKEIEEAYISGIALPKRSAHLTFDDGFIECFTVIRPILLELGIPATFFITTDFIDNIVFFSANLKSILIEKAKTIKDSNQLFVSESFENQFGNRIKDKKELIEFIKNIGRDEEEDLAQVSIILGFNPKEYIEENPLYLTEEQIKLMHSEGFTIGSHTRSHIKLGLIDEDLMEKEIVESSKEIQKITGQESVPFAFPNTGHGVDREKLKEIRTKHPFIGLIFDSKGFNEDADFIFNRVWGEHPDYITDNQHHKIPKILHRAYRDAFLLKSGDIFRRK